MKKILKYILAPAISIILFFYGNLLFQDITPSPANPLMPQTQIKTPGLLITHDGVPEEYGYMTTPLKLFNEDKLLPWQKLRVKKWDHFDVITDEFVITASFADVFYAGEIRSTYFDFKTRKVKDYKKLLLPYEIPKTSPTSYRFSNESQADNLIYESKDLTLKIENQGKKYSEKYNTRRAFVSIEPLGLELDLNLNVALDQESMTAVIPLTNEKQHFFYTVKMPNIEAEGTLKINNQKIHLTKENAGAFIDWGRGVWTYNTYWLFARGQGFLENGRMFSLNFASGYGDKELSQATEDAFFIDKVLYKLNTVEEKFDDNNLMNPWIFKTIDSERKHVGECEIIFTPHYIDRKTVNFFFVKSEIRVAFGQYSGWVTDNKNQKYTFENLNGFAEVHKAKW